MKIMFYFLKKLLFGNRKVTRKWRYFKFILYFQLSCLLFNLFFSIFCYFLIRLFLFTYIYFFSVIFNYKQGQTRYNEPTWLFLKRIICFFPKKPFPYQWILEQFFLQLVIINVYSCPNTWHLFFSSILNKYEILKVSWLLVNSMFLLLK
jgi:hypothetical protein